MKKLFKEIRNNYVKNQVKKIVVPELEASQKVRYHIIFSGKVQKVGFRLEVEQLATKLNLVGWIQNLENKDVEMELEGEDSKITFLLDFMNSLTRIKIHRMQKDKITLLENETQFVIC